MVAEINIPNNAISHYNEMNKIDKNAIIALLYYKEYADGNKTLGNIAEDLNISKRALYDIYENARMPIIRYGINDLNSDLRNLEDMFW